MVQNTSMNLLQETLSLLAKTKLSKLHIAEQCDVSYRWLINLANEESEHLSVTRVQRIHDFLSSNQEKEVA